MLGAWGVTACNGPTLVTIPLDGFGTANEMPIAARPGTELTFVLSLDRYSADTRNGIAVDFELKKGGRVVGTEMCPIFSTGKGSGGCGWASSSRNRGCSLLVPPGGADTIRATANLTDNVGRFEADGISVSVHGTR